MKKSLLLYLLAANIYAGGNEVGNGGDVVICKDQEAPVLLDYYERKEGNYTITPLEADDEYQIVQKILSRLEKIAPKLQEKYMRDLKEFRLKVKFKTQEELRDIKDSFHVSLGKECEIKQLAYQRKNSLTKDTEIFINKDLYEKMDAFQKAMLITHEIIYEHFIYFGEKNSIKVRLFNRYLYSEEIKDHKKSDLLKVGESLEIPLY